MLAQKSNAMRFLQQENGRLQADNEDLRLEVGQLRRILQALRRLYEISTQITSETDVFQLLDRILELALTTIRARDGSLLLVDDESEELAFVVVHGSVRDKLSGFRIPIGEGIAGWVAQEGEPVIIHDVYLDHRFSTRIDQSLNFITRSMVCVPIIWQGKVRGVIQGLNKEEGEEFVQSDLTLLGVVSQLAASAIGKAEETISE